MDSTAVNIMALGGKLAVESTSMDRFSKDGVKFCIDILADMAKSTQVSNRELFTVMGFTPEQVCFVKRAAQKHGLSRVIVFPCRINGAVIPCLHMEGGNVDDFRKEIGVSVFPQNSIGVGESELRSLIDMYGVILYQRCPY